MVATSRPSEPNAAPPASTGKCEHTGCEALGEWQPILGLWPKRGYLRFTVNPPLIFPMPTLRCSEHRELFQIAASGWKSICQVMKAQLQPVPDPHRGVMKWVEPPKDEPKNV